MCLAESAQAAFHMGPSWAKLGPTGAHFGMLLGCSRYGKNAVSKKISYRCLCLTSISIVIRKRNKLLHLLVVVKPWRNIISSLMGLQVMRSKISWSIL